MATQFRTKQILVSGAVYDALKVLADIEGHDCPDSVADLRLGLLLSNEAEIQWAIAERSRRMKKFREDYLQHVSDKKPDTSPSWKSAICHFGTSMNGKTLESIFLTGNRVPKTTKELDLLTVWFKEQITDSEEDKALWKSVESADAELRSGFAHEAANTPAVQPKAETAPVTEKPAQTTASPTDWRSCEIPGKNPKLSGHKLGEFEAEMKDVKEYADGIDLTRATAPQKAFVAKVAMALAELFPKTEESAVVDPTFNHTQALNDQLSMHKWDAGFFITQCKINKWLPETCRKIEDISASEFSSLEENWATVEEEMAKAHQSAQQP